MKKKLIIVGNSSFADIAFEYFQEGNEYEVIAFSVEENFLKSDEHLGLQTSLLRELNLITNPAITPYLLIQFTPNLIDCAHD